MGLLKAIKNAFRSSRRRNLGCGVYKGESDGFSAPTPQATCKRLYAGYEDRSCDYYPAPDGFYTWTRVSFPSQGGGKKYYEVYHCPKAGGPPGVTQQTSTQFQAPSQSDWSSAARPAPSRFRRAALGGARIRRNSPFCKTCNLFAPADGSGAKLYYGTSRRSY